MCQLLLNSECSIPITADVKRLYQDILRYDKAVALHCARVANCAYALAGKLGYNPAIQNRVYFAGLLHDYGKIYIPTKILNKKDHLSEKEIEVVKNHPWCAYVQLRGESALSEDMLQAILQHHERLDGNGYPNGETDICEFAKILTISDVFDALTSNRSYKHAYDADFSLEIIKEGVGTQFDEKVYSALVDLVHDHN